MAEAEAPSMAESVRAHIEKEMSEKIDFTIPSNRTNSIKRYVADHPEVKYGSASAAFSKQLEKVVKSQGLNPAEYRQKSKIKANYDQSMNAEIKHRPQDVPPPTAQNPQDPRGPPRPMGGGMMAPPPGPDGQVITPISEGAVRSFMSAAYGIFQAVANTEELTPGEAEDLGSLWHPVIGEKATSLRARALLAVGGTAGIMGKKWRQAKTKREKEKKPAGPPLQKPMKSTGAPIKPDVQAAPPVPEQPPADPAEPDPLAVYKNNPGRA
ncbi:MAG: hypothetical protein MPL62_04450 [Alphaproteobacteria bacterium]|nr:hypothetical protein [Alphaproteobacteria bacterium]